ncbi:MAG TPA: hypothetical protein PLP27_07390 [Crocinitomicaceae bacterium]|nr:hypothetical protein [Crocinitomicaceae bacterium]
MATTKKANLTTCSGMGKALKTSKSKGVRSAAGKTLATKCKTKGTLFAKPKTTAKKATCSACAGKKKTAKKK